jgi:hypothetical protein
MRSAILAVAVIAAVGVGAMAEPGNESAGRGRFPLIVQGLEGAATDLPRAAAEPRLVAPDHRAIPVSFSTSGQRFSCAQIRVMDEVELITDDSYCD